MAEQTEKDEKDETEKDEKEKDEKEKDEGGDGKPEYEAEAEKAGEEMREFEKQDDLPSDLKEWPDGKAKYLTFDNEGDEPYGEGLTGKLGAPVTHHDDGSVSVEGKGKVDNPEDYKGEPIPLALEQDDPSFNVSGDRNDPEDSEGSKEDSEDSEGSKDSKEDSKDSKSKDTEGSEGSEDSGGSEAKRTS